MITEESTLDKIRTRPRFKMASNLSKSEYFEVIKSRFSASSGKFEGRISKEESIIRVKNGRYPYWKPQLSLIASEEGGRTVIRGVFGPSSAVWTFFMFLYFAFGILWMVFITLWFVGTQIKIDDFSWALPVSFLMLAFLAIVYFSARYGQSKAKSEMAELRKFAEKSLLHHESIV